jgi:hypothetical protein
MIILHGFVDRPTWETRCYIKKKARNCWNCTSAYNITEIISYHPETKNLVNLKYKKGHNSGKNCRKIVIIEFVINIYKIHLHTTPSFNLTFCSQLIIRKPTILQIQKYKSLFVLPVCLIFGFWMITCERKVRLKLGVICKCILRVSRSSLIITIFQQFLPDLCPFLYFWICKIVGFRMIKIKKLEVQKKGHNSGKNCQKILIIKLDLDIHTIHIQTTSSFNLTFHAQVIIQKPIWGGPTDHTHYYSPLQRSAGGQ